MQSGNDATIVVAEGLAGSEAAFAELITKKAQKIGMVNSNFKNASGWPDADHYSTARDLAVLASTIVTKFPDYMKYFSIKEFTYAKIKQRNRNPLLYRDIGADGMKTGHTEDGGYGLMGTGTHDDRRVIVVVNGLESSSTRARESAKLLDWGLQRFAVQPVFKAGEAIASQPIKFGKDKEVVATVQEDLNLALPRLVEPDDIERDVVFNAGLTAPIKAGDPIGTMRLNIPQIEPYELTLYAQGDVAEKNIILRMIDEALYKAGVKQ